MNSQLNNSRKEFEKLGTLYAPSEQVAITQEIIENVTCYWFNPKEKVNTNRLIIYLHGGCFVLGSIHSHQALVSHLSEQLALPILFVEYSLAPEKPFPAPLALAWITYGCGTPEKLTLNFRPEPPRFATVPVPLVSL